MPALSACSSCTHTHTYTKVPSWFFLLVGSLYLPVCVFNVCFCTPMPSQGQWCVQTHTVHYTGFYFSDEGQSLLVHLFFLVDTKSIVTLWLSNVTGTRPFSVSCTTLQCWIYSAMAHILYLIWVWMWVWSLNWMWWGKKQCF